MASMYDRADIYDLTDTEGSRAFYKKYWEQIFAGRNVKKMLDVSIGSGSVTIPVLDLGIELSGSDLSDTMLANCGKKIEKVDKKATLKQSDFRSLDCWGDEKFDMVASTGNSLAYVSNDDVCAALEQMDKHVADGGYLYYDSRNWEMIFRNHQRFYLYNPFFDGDTRVNLVQVWDYPEDGSIIFNLLFTFEKDNKMFQKEHFEEHYNPFPKDLAVNKLKELGYKDIEIREFPTGKIVEDFDNIEWYSVLARK